LLHVLIGEDDFSIRQELEEIKRLRRENAVLKQEREILKKATAFFAKMSH
jgi:transposase-like protein